MPKYKVIERGFYEGRMYDPNGKRRFLHRDTPFPKGKDKAGKTVELIPSWLESMGEESAAERRKRQAAEKKAAADAQAKKQDDAQEIENMSFMGEGEAAHGAAVETL